MPRPRGITLVDVMVLLVIGGVLLGLAVVGIQQARVRSRRDLRTERLGQIALGPWIAGGRGTVRGMDLKSSPLLGNDGQFGGLHPGGANVLKANAAATFVSSRIDPSVLAAMATFAGAPADEPDP